MLRNFAFAVFVGFFLVSTAFVVPITNDGGPSASAARQS